MAQNSFALVTNLGRAKEAAALANATVIEITHIAIGDGMTVPSGGETALYSEIARKLISGHGTVIGASNVAYFDIFLAADEGPYTIREAGLYDAEGDLIAIARYDPPINKPIPSSGQTVEGTVRLEVAFSNVANIVIVVDPSFQIPLQRLSRLPWLPVISMSTVTPPVVPVVGDIYLIPTGATGSWAGHVGKIAEYTPAGWGLMSAPDGHGVSLPDGRIFERISGTYVEKIAQDVQSGKWNYAVAAGTANALIINLTPALAAYVAGTELKIKVLVDNTGPATININGLGARPIKRAVDMTLLKSSDLVAGSIATVTYDGSSWLMSDAVTILAPLNRFYNRDGTSAITNVTLTPAAAGAMHFGINDKHITYNLPPATEFGIGYIGFMNNVNAGVTINSAPGDEGGGFQFMNNPYQKTIELLESKSWVILFSDGSNWLVISGDPGLNASLAQSLNSTGYKKHDGGLIEQWGSSVAIVNSGGFGAVAFPHPFDHVCFTVIPSNGYGDNPTLRYTTVSTLTSPRSTGFDFFWPGAEGATVRINWIAKGY